MNSKLYNFQSIIIGLYIIVFFSQCTLTSKNKDAILLKHITVNSYEYEYYLKTIKDSLQQIKAIQLWNTKGQVDSSFLRKCKLYDFCVKNNYDTLPEYIIAKDVLEKSLLGNQDGILKNHFSKHIYTPILLSSKDYQLYRDLSKRIIQYQYIKLPSDYSKKNISPLIFDSIFNKDKIDSNAGYVTHFWPNRISGNQESLMLHKLKLDSISPIYTKGHIKYAIKIKREVENKDSSVLSLTNKTIKELVSNKNLTDNYQLYIDSILSSTTFSVDTVSINQITKNLNQYQNNYRLSCNDYLKSIGTSIIAQYNFDNKQFNISINELYSNINRWRLEYSLISNEDIKKECQNILINSILSKHAEKESINTLPQYKTNYKLANINLLPRVTINTAIENKLSSNPELVKQYYNNNIHDFPCSEEVEISLLYFKSTKNLYQAYSKYGDNLFINTSLKPIGLIEPLHKTTISGACKIFNKGFVGRILSDSTGTVKMYNKDSLKVALLKIGEAKGHRNLKFNEAEREIERMLRKLEKIKMEESFLTNYLF